MAQLAGARARMQRRVGQALWKAVAPEDPIVTAEERRAEGKAVRKQVPRSSHADWQPPADRPNPVELLRSQGETRVQALLPLRYERMSASAFTFYRGGALIMASDLSNTPDTGITLRACGDAHISNFGLFSSPERRTVFDINDFDETYERQLEHLAEICGRTLAHAHARTGDRFAIAGYLGSSDKFDRAVARFATAYADQNEADYHLFMQALSSGELDA